MVSNFFTLIKIGRALAKSNSLSIFEEFYKPPLSIKVLIKIFGFTTFNKDSANKSAGERLKNAFLKIGAKVILFSIQQNNKQKINFNLLFQNFLTIFMQL